MPEFASKRKTTYPMVLNDPKHIQETRRIETAAADDKKVDYRSRLNFNDNTVSSMLESHEGKTNPSPEEKISRLNQKTISISSAGI